MLLRFTRTHSASQTHSAVASSRSTTQNAPPAKEAEGGSPGSSHSSGNGANKEQGKHNDVYQQARDETKAELKTEEKVRATPLCNHS